MSWTWSRWRDRPDGGSWWGFEPTGVIVFVSLFPFVLPFLGWLSLAVTLVAAMGWADIHVTREGVRARRWVGPVPWSWRWYAAGGGFEADIPHDGVPNAVLYQPAGVSPSLDEPVLAWRRDCETIVRQLEGAAARAWGADP